VPCRWMMSWRTLLLWLMDNSAEFIEFKEHLRSEVLARVSPSRVLDVYAGRGEMWSAVWHRAGRYLGVDRRMWRSDEPHNRLVMDNMRALEVLDLSAFNIFDIDAYGEPWSRARLISGRRKWAPGEQGAMLFTDGTSLKIRFGQMPKSALRLIPTPQDIGIRDVTEEAHAQCVAALCRRANVRPTWWSIDGGHVGRGSQVMFYSAVVFEGIAS